MKVVVMAAVVGLGLLASAGTASADPWKDESGQGRRGGKHWKHEGRGHGHGWSHRHRHHGIHFGGYGRPRGYGYYSGHYGYRGAHHRGYDW